MPTPILLVVTLNSLTLLVALGLLLLMIWYDVRRPTNLSFALFLVFIVTWSAGALISRLGSVVELDANAIIAGLHLLEFGFACSALALGIYVFMLMGSRSRQFYIVALGVVLILLTYQAILIQSKIDYTITSSNLLRYEFQPISRIIYFSINAVTLGLVWQGFRKIQRPALIFGVMLFCLGQVVALMSPRLQVLGVAEDASALATFVMASALVRYQIIQPLAGQSRQIEVTRDVGLAITSRLRLQNVLETIATQAAILLRADASLIFLKPEDSEELVLAAQYNIHENLLGHRLNLRQGVAGKVASEYRPIRLSDYRNEWHGVPDTPFAEIGFGSVVAVPLLFSREVVGVLLVINGVHNHIFEPEDVRLLELLAPQAAVAITNSRLFEQERALSSKLEAAITQLEAFLLSTDNPVIALDKRLRIIFSNKAATELIGRGMLHDQSLMDLVPREYLPANLRGLVTDLKTRRSHVYELNTQDKTFLCHLARVEQPRRGWVAVLNDVTSLKELDRLQRQMIELTTHQLKNPLQAAMLHLDELEDLGEDVLTEEMRYDLSVVWEQLDRMQRLVASILNVERLQSRSTPRNEQVDFSQTTKSVVESLRQLAAAKAIQLSVKVPDENLPLVLGDPGELAEAVSNLVDNAIKYTPRDGHIEVEACAEDGNILLKVIDSGIGIPESEHHRIFDRFYRVEQSGTEQISGTGMGLSLVKAIVDRHHGRIWLDSVPDEGTTFYISLPGIQ